MTAPAPTWEHGLPPSTQATPAAPPVGVASPAELLGLLREARAYVPSLTELAHMIDDVLRDAQPYCIFCGSVAHWSMDCRGFSLTEQGKEACR